MSNSFLPGIKEWIYVSCSSVDDFLSFFFLRDKLPGVTGTLFIFLPFGVFLLTTHTIGQIHIKAASAENANNIACLGQPLMP